MSKPGYVTYKAPQGHGATSLDDITPNTHDLIVKAFARNGTHCDTARLIFMKGTPKVLQRACDDARALFLAAK